MKTIGERLKWARAQRGMTQAALASEAKVSTSAIGNVESGLREKPRELNALARALRASATWLETGKGSWDSDNNVEAGPNLSGLVPLISWEQASSWNPTADPLTLGDAERWMPCPAPHSSGTFALRVRGDSMTAQHINGRTYPEGSFVYVDPAKRSPMNGDRIIAKLSGEDEVTFKVYKNEDGRQWLQPLNPAHEPIRQAFQVLGTIIGKWEDG